MGRAGDGIGLRAWRPSVMFERLQGPPLPFIELGGGQWGGQECVHARERTKVKKGPDEEEN